MGGIEGEMIGPARLPRLTAAPGSGTDGAVVYQTAHGTYLTLYGILPAFLREQKICIMRAQGRFD
jgi:hypothetical protein